jgi:hypothetical protein
MTAKSVTEVVAAIVKELTPLGAEERRRVIQASLVLLGDAPVVAAVHAPDVEDEVAESSLPPRARAWTRQNGLSLEELQQTFHIEGDDCQLIVSEIPGRANRDRVRNAYLLVGAARLIATGEPRFDDRGARDLCERFGFFDPTNHSKYVKGGNEFTGSREKGWTLTAPGLKQAALLISEFTRAS